MKKGCIRAVCVMMIAVFMISAVEGDVISQAKKVKFTMKKGILYCAVNGKKVKNTTKKYKGKKYYFSSKGKGFISQKNSKRNKAVAKIYDKVSFSKSGKKDRLKALYKGVMKNSSYLGVGKPDLNADWITTQASDMASKGRGNCYSYSSLIGLLAKSVGYKVKVITGKCKRSTDAEHSWVVVGGKYVLDGVYEDQGYTDGAALRFFYKTYSRIKSSVGYVYTAGRTYAV